MARAQSTSNRTTPARVAGPRLLLLLSVLALMLIGLVMVYSASSVKAIDSGSDATSYLFDQVKYAAIGIAAALVLWRINYTLWSGKLVWAGWAVIVVLLILVAVAGRTDYGATRWLNIGPFSMQPSEFAKIIFIMMSAKFIWELRNGTSGGWLCVAKFFFIVLVPLAFLFKTQSDLGTTAICCMGIIAVLWLGEVPTKTVMGITALVVIVAIVAVFFVDYRADRFSFIDPWNDGEGGYGSGYNIKRSYYALAEGGLFGVGLGNSHEKYLYLFASESDFIFSIIGEELGMVGALAVIGLFLLFLYAGLRIAVSAPDGFGCMLAGGCTIMIAFQAFLNIACCIGVFPTTGKPLPFISSGGSSIIATLIMVGLIMSVSRASGGPSVYDRRRADLRIVRERS